MCFGGGSQTVTTKSTPELPKQYESILNTGNNIDQNWIKWLKGGNNELDQSDYAKTVAGFTPDQRSSQLQIRAIAESPEFKNQMRSALGLVGKGGTMTGDAGQMIKSAVGGPDISAFFNPYQKDVIDTTLGAMDKRTGEQRAQLLASQAGKKAFGSGSDISTSLFNRDAEDRAAQTLAQLQQSGWNTALGAAQNQQRTELQGAQQYGALGSQYGALGQQYGALAGQQQSGLLGAQSALAQSGLNQQNFNQFQIDRPLNLAQQHIGMVSGAKVGTTSEQTVPGPSPFSQILGAATSGAKLFGLFADGGLADRSAFADGGMVDMAQWAEVPTDQILFMLQKMDPSDPDRGIVAEVYSRRQRDEGNRPAPRSAFDNGAVQDVPAESHRLSLGLGVTNKPVGDASWGSGRTNPITPAPAWQNAIATGVRSAFDNGEAADVFEPAAPTDPRNTQDYRPALPTDMRQPSAFEQGAAAQATQMADDARKRRSQEPIALPAPAGASGDSFLGAAPAFDMMDLGQGGGMADQGLSFSGKPGQKLTFPKMADAVDNLVSAVPGASGGAGPRRPSGGGLSFNKRRAAAPSMGALGPAAPSAFGSAPASSPSATGSSSADQPQASGGFGDRVRKAMDDPLFWIGLGLMSSHNPNFLGALGEGVAGGISAFSNREAQKSKQAREDQKAAQDLALERAKLGAQQTSAANQQEMARARLGFMERADQRAARSASKPSALQEKIAAMQQMGATPDEIKRAVAGFKPEDDAEAQKQRFILDGLKKDPYGDPAALGDSFDSAMVTGASTDDLMGAVGMSAAGFADGGRPVEGPGDGRDDMIPAALSDGEFVVPADVVSALGRGSTKAGAQMLSAFTQQIRKGHVEHMQKLPAPKA
ncbi:MAG: hypothetical protein ACRC67_07170 [Inquilinus sp.]|uniref:hypothetical protein n=1 Tax=Inquilinus sp. TaxID=1932117 RepID=UPI003F2B64E7